MTNHPTNPWPHRFAIAMVCVTFPLIWVGGLVTTHQAGMAVPDWPNTYGYNLFLYPLSTWLAGPFDLFIEHGHRLLGALVGLLTIGFTVAAFRSEQRGLRWLAVLALVAVIGQGALGGMRVVLDERTLAMIHGCVGPAFFAFAVALTAMTSSRWNTNSGAATFAGAARLHRIALATTVLAYLQLTLGAQLRHAPVDAGPRFFHAAVYLHLLVAAALVLHIAMTVYRALQVRSSQSRLTVPAIGLAALVLIQLSLGVATWVVKYGWPAWMGDYNWAASYVVVREDVTSSLVVTAHVATGSLILVTSLLVALRSLRFLREPILDRATVVAARPALLEATA